MTLEEFAKSCGVKIVSVEPDWGGTVGYTEADSPNCTVCGFKTEAGAYKSWLQDKFGKNTAKQVMKLLGAKK